MISPTLLLSINLGLMNLLISTSVDAKFTSDVGQGSFLHFAYPGFQAPVYFDEYEELLGPSVLKMCVRREYPPEKGDQCRSDRKVCLWGSQRCGADNDVLEPTSRCNCVNNEWACQAFLCPTMGATCPEKPSIGIENVADLPICKADLTCGYMEKTCEDCNVTVPTIQ